jgi:hypothetical protein
LSLEPLRLLWRLRSKKNKIQVLQFEPGRIHRHDSFCVVTAHYFAKLCAHCVVCDLRLRALVNHTSRHKAPQVATAASSLSSNRKLLAAMAN